MKSSAKTERAAYRRLASSDIGILFGRRSSSRGITMELPRRRFLHLATGAAASPPFPASHQRSIILRDRFTAPMSAFDLSSPQNRVSRRNNRNSNDRKCRGDPQCPLWVKSGLHCSKKGRFRNSPLFLWAWTAALRITAVDCS